MRIRVYFLSLSLSLFSSVDNSWMINLRSSGALRWKAEDHRLGRAVSVMWKASTSKVVASACIG
jgi:hypothetical protein